MVVRLTTAGATGTVAEAAEVVVATDREVMLAVADKDFCVLFILVETDDNAVFLLFRATAVS